MMTDPIADMLSRLRNASLAHQDRTEIPHSIIKTHLAEILKAEGYINDFSVASPADAPKSITVILKYGRERVSAFKGLRRTSRPGRRLYVGHEDIPVVLNGMGIAILSTSRGVMTDKDARAQRVGGEVLCEVW
jgi:small subunit ribosomal protein S8